jgi:hypothetical protein
MDPSAQRRRARGWRDELRELSALAVFVLGPLVGFWAAWAGAPDSSRSALLAGVLAGAALMLAYALFDRTRRGSFFIRNEREIEQRKASTTALLPIYVAAALALIPLARTFGADAQRAGAGFLIGAIGAAAPIVVANYIRLHSRTKEG